MRIWHKDLISVLPRQQLLGQVREITAIIKNIQEKGTPNHILVNKIMQYHFRHFVSYCLLIEQEMNARKYKLSEQTLNKWHDFFEEVCDIKNIDLPTEIIFWKWHNYIYLRQCLYNLEEKAMCKGMTEQEWNKIYEKFSDRFDLQKIY